MADVLFNRALLVFEDFLHNKQPLLQKLKLLCGKITETDQKNEMVFHHRAPRGVLGGGWMDSVVSNLGCLINNDVNIYHATSV